MYIISPFTNQTGGVERHAKFIYETFKKKYNLILIEPKLVSNLNFKFYYLGYLKMKLVFLR